MLQQRQYHSIRGSIRQAYPLRVLVPGLFILLLLLSVLGEHFERRDLVATINKLRESMDTLLDGANDNYNHALMINEIGQAISKQIQIDDILFRVNEVFRKWLDYDRGLILLQNKDKTLLEYRDGYGYREDELNLLKATSFHLDKGGSKGSVRNLPQGKKAFPGE
jgi:hypothetical protein